MSTAHARFTAEMDTTNFTKNVRAMETNLVSSTGRMQSSMKNAFSMRGIGGASMQFSDIAVQLQGGAKAATVIAQQGSQILQYFGPAGAIAGAVVAIGAGFVTWATNAEAAEKRTKEALKSAEALQAFQTRMDNEGSADRHRADMLGIGGDRADFGRLQMQFERDISEMQKQFDNTPAAERDSNKLFDRKQSRKALFEAERQQLFDVHEERREAKENAEARLAQENDVRGMERQQMQEFAAMQKQNADDEKEAREGLIDSIEQADKVQKENTERNERLGELESRLQSARSNQRNAGDVASGNAFLGRASEFMSTSAERAAERELGQRQERAEKRSVNEFLDRSDRFNRRHGGSGLTQEERERMRGEAMSDINKAKGKEKIEATVAAESIQEIVGEIRKLHMQ
jgi:hypothetical protein